MAIKRAQVEDEAKSTTYRVAEGTQVHLLGKTYEGGEVVDLERHGDLVTLWLNAGWVTPA